MIKIVIISHTFQKEEYYRRWELMADTYKDLDITLLAPTDWSWGAEKNLTYGTVEKVSGKEIEKENFRIHLIRMSNDRLGDWTSKDMTKELLEIKPDVIYLLSIHTQLALTQILHLRNTHRTLKNTKVLSFSMRGHQQSLHKNFNRGSIKKDVRAVLGYGFVSFKLWYFNHYADAAFCHHPDAVSEFRREGYKKNIYMQTQVGYDSRVFHRDIHARKQIRDKYDIGENEFVFGSASRFHYSKGLLEVIEALPADREWKYLMMGWGNDEEVQRIKDEIKKRGFENRIILTGYINEQQDMAAHWNALDCAVHSPLTTPEWEETFSLALIQAMGTGLPVIGSSSGSVPYQIGPEGIIVQEKNIEKLSEKMRLMIDKPEEAQRIGERMYQRATKCFDIRQLNELWRLTVMNILDGKFDEATTDMVGYRINRGEYVCTEK